MSNFILRFLSLDRKIHLLIATLLMVILLNYILSVENLIYYHFARNEPNTNIQKVLVAGVVGNGELKYTKFKLDRGWSNIYGLISIRGGIFHLRSLKSPIVRVYSSESAMEPFINQISRDSVIWDFSKGGQTSINDFDDSGKQYKSSLFQPLARFIIDMFVSKK